MNAKPIKEPQTISDRIEQIQIILAGIVGTIVIIEWVSTWDLIVNIFKPNYLGILSAIRVGLASFGLIISALIGIRATLWLVGRALELREVYSKLLEDKKKIDKDKE